MASSPFPTTASQFSVRLARTSGLALFAALILAIPAAAHQPVALNASNSKVANSPIMVDGTISFAISATTTATSLTRSFRFYLADGERLNLQYLILDQRPENQLSTANLPQVNLLSPQGKNLQLKITERTPFFEPFSRKKYLYLSRLNTAGEAGIYTVTIKAKRAGSVVIALGTRETSGVVLEVGSKVGQCPIPPATGSEISQTMANQLVGMTERAAQACAMTNKWSFRTIARDGEDFPVTMDYRMDRINLKVSNDRVIEVTVG